MDDEHDRRILAADPLALPLQPLEVDQGNAASKILRDGDLAESDVSVPTSQRELESLLSFFKTFNGRLARSDQFVQLVQERSTALYQKDYWISLLDNSEPAFCATYPLHVIVPEGFKSTNALRPTAPIASAGELKRIVEQGHFARAHGRFVAPSILVNEKLICRSATLSVNAETILSCVRAKTFAWWRKLQQGLSSKRKANFSLEAQRSADKQQLKLLRVRNIVDMMTEEKKLVFGFAVASSEKADPTQYDEYELHALPYPGCEFFEEFTKCGRGGCEKLFFDWKVDGKPSTPRTSEELEPLFDFHLSEYQTWSLVEITNNYMRILYALIFEDKKQGGVLLHCISGWDRTPLFISLLRLSLWADGFIHQSLQPHEVLYLTVAYDWMLFGHKLYQRAPARQDILGFCFHFLSYMESDNCFGQASFPSTSTRTHDSSEQDQTPERPNLVSRSHPIDVPTSTKTLLQTCPASSADSNGTSGSLSWHIIDNPEPSEAITVGEPDPFDMGTLQTREHKLKAVKRQFLAAANRTLYASTNHDTIDDPNMLTPRALDKNEVDANEILRWIPSRER